MRNILLTLSLLLALTVTTLADGEIPISGYQGCAPGLWYPISEVCCMPGLECPVGRSAPADPDKSGSKLVDIDLVRVILYFRSAI